MLASAQKCWPRMKGVNLPLSSTNEQRPAKKARSRPLARRRQPARQLRPESQRILPPVLGLIFLKFADNKYRQHEAAILAEYQKLKGSRLEKKLSDVAIERCGFYLPDHARYDHLLALPEKEDIPPPDLRLEVGCRARYSSPIGNGRGRFSANRLAKTLA